MRRLGSGHSDSVEIEEILKYTKDAEFFLFFAENVTLEKRISLLSSPYDRYSEGLEEAFVKLGYKSIRPTRILCMRMIQEGIGINSFHVRFLQLVIQSSLWKEALPLL